MAAVGLVGALTGGAGAPAVTAATTSSTLSSTQRAAGADMAALEQIKELQGRNTRQCCLSLRSQCHIHADRLLDAICADITLHHSQQQSISC